MREQERQSADWHYKRQASMTFHLWSYSSKNEMKCLQEDKTTGKVKVDDGETLG